MRKLALLLVLTLILATACQKEVISDPMKDELTSVMESAKAMMDKVKSRLATVADMQAARDGDGETTLALLQERPPWLVGADVFVTSDGVAWVRGESFDMTAYPFWKTLREGDEVLGASMIDPVSGQPSVLVCLPVPGEGGLASCVGRLIWLEGMRQRMVEEIEMQPEHVFFILDEQARTLLDSSDKDLIFDEPLKQDSVTLRAAIQEIMGEENGSVSYSWADVEKVCLFKQSPVLGWRFAISAPKQ